MGICIYPNAKVFFASPHEVIIAELYFTYTKRPIKRCSGCQSYILTSHRRFGILIDSGYDSAKAFIYVLIVTEGSGGLQ